MSTTINQEILFTASPQHLYEALLDAKQFSELTGGATAQIDRDPGGAFCCFDGMISGRQIELKPNQRIVQAWRAGNWPEGVYSIVRFELSAEGSGTRLRFAQAGFPQGQQEPLGAGWHRMYWEPLRKYLS